MQMSEKAYKTVCPICGKIFYAQLSMAMEMGQNRGHGSCPKCKTFLRLKLHKKQTAMIALPWEVYLKRLELKKTTN